MILLLLSLSAYCADFLVEDSDGQKYYKDTYSYIGEGKILYKGELTEEQKEALGALSVHPVTGKIVIDKDKLKEEKDKKKALDQKASEKKNSKAQAKQRLKNSENPEIKDLMILLEDKLDAL